LRPTQHFRLLTNTSAHTSIKLSLELPHMSSFCFLPHKRMHWQAAYFGQSTKQV